MGLNYVDNLLFRWRKAFMSDIGPTSPTTRHVLLTLSTHMEIDGTGAFPSIVQLAAESALSTRAVKNHLALAASLGWIDRKPCRRMGQKWRNYEYRPRFPIPEEAGERRSPPSSRKVVQIAQKLVTVTPKLVNDVHTSTSTSTSITPLSLGKVLVEEGRDFEKTVALRGNGAAAP